MKRPSCVGNNASKLDSNELASLSDADLAMRSRSNSEAFAQLFDRYYGVILNYAFHATLDVELAEELTARTFFKALRGLGSYSDRGTFRAWLFRIAMNEIRLDWRSRRSRLKHNREYGHLLGRIEFTEHPAQVEEDREQRLMRFDRLHEALDRLPERYRTTLVLRYFEGLSIDEIAQVMGTKSGTVKSLVHRGLKRLRRIFEKKRTTDRKISSQNTQRGID